MPSSVSLSEIVVVKKQDLVPGLMVLMVEELGK